jgi:hypothetical protein
MYAQTQFASPMQSIFTQQSLGSQAYAQPLTSGLRQLLVNPYEEFRGLSNLAQFKRNYDTEFLPLYQTYRALQDQQGLSRQAFGLGQGIQDQSLFGRQMFGQGLGSHAFGLQGMPITSGLGQLAVNPAEEMQLLATLAQLKHNYISEFPALYQTYRAVQDQGLGQQARFRQPWLRAEAGIQGPYGAGVCGPSPFGSFGLGQGAYVDPIAWGQYAGVGQLGAIGGSGLRQLRASGGAGLCQLGAFSGAGQAGLGDASIGGLAGAERFARRGGLLREIGGFRTLETMDPVYQRSDAFGQNLWSTY